jgi:two-component system, cell cycle sensor histidine kinase and response regulator CckA
MKTLLVLEDEPPVLKLLWHMLKQYNVIEAASAEQALLLCGQNRHQIDLLVADVTLPAGSGIQVALALRAQIRDLPVVLTSGYPVTDWSPGDTAHLEELGSESVAILQKPFLAQELLSAVRRLTGEPQATLARTA